MCKDLVKFKTPTTTPNELVAVIAYINFYNRIILFAHVNERHILCTQYSTVSTL